ncbi:MAG: ATP-binding cassette domain-containing protein [bacterium]|nr:ATP-binding cassette domain-containing protein [bacterium]
MIQFTNVSKQFGDAEYALKDISFEIADGEFVLITGPSGSGKTTLIRMLTREYTPTSGDILFDDESLVDLKKSKVHLHRRKLGVVFQDYKLLPELNVWENIALALNIIGKSESETETRVTDLLKLVNLVEKAYLFPSQLSGGEAQRVSIARALATGPSVICADEPTGNLDQETSLAIAKLLKKINQLGTTVLFATHDIGVLAALKDERHLFIKHGDLVEDRNNHRAQTKKSSTTEEVVETKVDEKESKKSKFSLPFGKKKEQPSVEVENL